MWRYLTAGIILLMWVNYWQYTVHEEDLKKISGLEMDLALSMNTVIEKERQIDGLNSLRKEDQASILDYGLLVNILETKYSDANKKLEGYKKREHIALAKPALVGKLVNRATARVFDDLGCATGSTDKGC